MSHFARKLKFLSLVFSFALSLLTFNEITHSNASNNISTQGVINNNEKTNNSGSYQTFTASEIDPTKITFVTNESNGLTHTTISSSYTAPNVLTTLSAPSGYRLPFAIDIDFLDTSTNKTERAYDSENNLSNTEGKYYYHYDYSTGEIKIGTLLYRKMVSRISNLTIYAYSTPSTIRYWSDDGIRSTSLSLKDPSSSNSSTNPYYIKNGGDLGLLAHNYLDRVFINSTEIYVEVENDIDLNGYYFMPIGYNHNEFNGVFDGNNKTISNLNLLINEYLGKGSDGYGLFDSVNGTESSYTIIKDLTIKNTKYSYSVTSSIKYDTLPISSLCGTGHYFTAENIFIDGFSFVMGNNNSRLEASNLVFGAIVAFGTCPKYNNFQNIDVNINEITMDVKCLAIQFGGIAGYTNANVNGASCFYNNKITINNTGWNETCYTKIGGFVGTLQNDQGNSYVNNVVISTASGYDLSSVFDYTFNYTGTSDPISPEIYASSFIGYFYYGSIGNLYIYNCETYFKSSNSEFRAFILKDTSTNEVMNTIHYGNISGCIYGGSKASAQRTIYLFNCDFFVDGITLSSVRGATSRTYSEIFPYYYNSGNELYLNFANYTSCLINADESLFDIYFEAYSNSLADISNALSFLSNISQNSYLHSNSQVRFAYVSSMTPDLYSVSGNFIDFEKTNLETYRDSLNTYKNTESNLTDFSNISTYGILSWVLNSNNDELHLNHKRNINKYVDLINDPIKETTNMFSTVEIADPTPIQNKVFAGWYYDSGFTKPLKNLNTIHVFGSDVNVYAKFVDGVTVNFDTNGGSVKDSITGGVSLPLTLGDNPTKDGYTFAGWYTDSSLNNEFTSNVYPSADLTLYAKWTENEKNQDAPVIVFPHPTFNINYVTNGGVINDTSYPTSYKTGDTVVLPSDVTKASATFLGWYDNDNFSGSSITSLSKFALGDFTFYAKWKEDKVEPTTITHNIKYVLNNGTINDSNYATTFIEGVGTNELPKDVTLDGFTFAGWYSNQDFTGDQIKEISSETKSDVTLYAKFIKNTDNKDNNGNKLYWLWLLLLIPVIGLAVWLVIFLKKKKAK